MIPREQSNLPAVMNTYTLVPKAAAPEADNVNSTLPITHYWWVIWKRRWLIGAFIAIAALTTLFISLRITPVYEATATLDIDRRTPSGVVGRESEVVTNDSEQFITAQIRLLQSDSVLRPVAQKFNLIDFSRVSTDSKQITPAEAPVRLSNLRVTRVPNASMLLVSYRSTDPRLAAEISNAISASYIEYTYRLRITSSNTLSAFMEKQLEELKAKMERSADAVQKFERGMNVINPEQKTSLASARLEELNTQLTQVQTERLRKEAALNAVKGGSLEALQVSTQGEPAKRLAERLDEATDRFNAVKAQLGTKHPEYQKAAAEVASLQESLERVRGSVLRRIQSEYNEAQNREQVLSGAVNQAKIEADSLNQHSFGYQSVKQEAESDKKLYEELVRKIKEASINSGFQNNAIRLADPARPVGSQIFPDIQRNLILAIVLSMVVAIAVSLLHDVTDTTVRDPELVRALFQTDVVGSLPLVRGWKSRRLLSAASVPDGKAGELVRFGEARDRPIAIYDEAIRTLRNSVLLSEVSSPRSSIMFTSAMPAEGKTTTSVHFAVAHAQQGNRTLLIDADLRRPGVHRALGMASGRGLSDVFLHGMDWRSVVQELPDIPNLDILPAGPPSRMAADLVGRGMADIIAQATGEYDFIIVDAPPLLGFSEPLRIAVLVDGVVVVALAGQTDRKAVSAAIGTLRRLKANLVGVVLNEITRELSSSYSYYGYYGKYYSYYHTGKSRVS